jgi:hypothetical protein
MGLAQMLEALEGLAERLEIPGRLALAQRMEGDEQP